MSPERKIPGVNPRIVGRRIERDLINPSEFDDDIEDTDEILTPTPAGIDVDTVEPTEESSD